MYTSILVFALTGLAPAADVAGAPSWQRDYAAARKLGASAGKPLAVVLGSGQNGWQKLSRDGQLGTDAKKLLASKYVCVYVDTASEQGQKLAEAFNMADGFGIIISDRTGELQAFRHEGDLAEPTLVSYLQRYSDPTHEVVNTETNPNERVSNYPAESAVGAPAGSVPWLNSVSGSCPNCGGGGGRRR